MKEKGIDDYTGSYTANYKDFSDTEYLFGGTSIKREAGKDLFIDCALEVTDGTAKVFWISRADGEATLLGTTGTYSDTIIPPEGGNYIGIECEDFTGSIESNTEQHSARRRQKKKSCRKADTFPRAYKTVVLISEPPLLFVYPKPTTT